MPTYRILIVAIVGTLFITGCTGDPYLSDVQNNPDSTSNWLIDTDQIRGSEITNSFPIAIEPTYTDVNSISFSNGHRLQVLKAGGQVFAYPFNYLGFEVLNDHHNGEYFTVTYCPLTKSTVVLNRQIENDTLTLAASGILFKSNLVLYDTTTNSLWSQMLLKGVRGKHIQKVPSTVHSFETKWETIKKYFPEAKIFTGDYETPEKTGKNDLSTNNSYEAKNTQDSNKGSYVYGMFPDSPKPMDPFIYTKDYADMKEKITVESIGNIVVISSKKYDFLVSFFKGGHNFTAINDEFPVIMKDENGVKYNIFGESVSSGTPKLENPAAFFAFWWAWDDFFNNFEEV